MTTRRAVLASSVAVLGAFAGCSGQTVQTTTESAVSEPTATATTTRATTTPTATTTADTETATTRTTTETDEASPYDPPELNRTDYPVAWEWAMPNHAIGDDSDPRWALLTTDDWQRVVDESVLSAESTSFLEETDFTSESVVAVQSPVIATYNRLILHSVDGVGTRGLTLRMSEWESESGKNGGPTHLLLVRVPNQGVEPERANVHWLGLTDGD